MILAHRRELLPNELRSPIFISAANALIIFAMGIWLAHEVGNPNGIVVMAFAASSIMTGALTYRKLFPVPTRQISTRREP